MRWIVVDIAIQGLSNSVDLLDDGYVYACDFGELRFTTYAIITLLKAIRGDNANSPPPTNLAFVFLDSAVSTYVSICFSQRENGGFFSSG